MASILSSGTESEGIVNKKPFKIQHFMKDGLLLQIHHTITDNKKQTKCIRFVTARFSDNHEQIVALDQAGNVFIIDMLNLKFWMVPVLNGISAVVFSTHKKNEILVAKDNGVVDLINIDTGIVTGRLIGHRFPVSWISFSDGYSYCLTATKTEAFIWDLETNSQIHQLTLHTTIKLKLVRFTPVYNNIIACFEDDTIQVWKFKNWVVAFQMSPERWSNHTLNATAFSRNGNTMIAGGNTSVLLVISLKDCSLKSTFNLPEKIVGIKQLEFLPQSFDGGENDMFLALTNDFTVHIISFTSKGVLQSIKSPSTCVCNLLCSDNGKYTVFILDTGELNVYMSEKLFPAVSNFSAKTKKGVAPVESTSIYHKTCVKSDSDIEKLVKSKIKSSMAVRTSRGRQTEVLQDRLQKQVTSTINLNKLRPILREFGEYPEKYRHLIWKNVLKLPNNKSAFEALLNKGQHIKAASVCDTYPLQNTYLLNSLKRLVSCLSHWCPLFSQVQYLPQFVFPFVKVFRNDPQSCFEAVATILVNWCQRWFEFHPFPPVNVLSLVENVLGEWDEKLLTWFTDNQVSADVYAWPLLETAFSEVFTGEEWVQLFDNILSNEPAFIIFAVVSYNIICRSALLSITDISDFKFFYRHQTSINMKRFISKIYEMNSRTKADNHPRNHLKPFKPLLHGETYEIFNDYPKFVIDKQADEMNVLMREELDLLKEQSRLACARLEQEKEHEKNLRHQIHSIQLRDLETKYKEVINEEEMRLAEHRHKVMKMRKDLRKREKQLLDETREEVMQQNAEKRKIELETLLRDIDRKRVLQEMLMKEAEDELFEQYDDLVKQKKELQFQLSLNDCTTNATPPPEHTILKEQQELLFNEINKLREEAALLHDNRQQELANRLAVAEGLLQTVEVQLAQEMAERQNTLLAGQRNAEVIQLEKETGGLEKEVERLMNELVQLRLKESINKEKLLKASLSDRKTLLDKQKDAAKTLADIRTNDNGIRASTANRNDTGSSKSSSISEKEYGNTRLQSASNKSLLNSEVPYYPNVNNDFLTRSSDFYKKEQEAIRSSMNIRQKLLRRQ